MGERLRMGVMKMIRRGEEEVLELLLLDSVVQGVALSQLWIRTALLVSEVNIPGCC